MYTQAHNQTSQRLDEKKKAIVIKFMPLVKFVTQRIWDRLPSHIDIQDLEHAGMLGLMDAVCRYDEKHNNLFKTYAEHRIRGAILDDLRKNDWMKRRGREKYKLLEQTIAFLEKSQKREPTSDEIAAALGMKMEEYFSFFRDAHSGVLMSLHRLIRKQDFREEMEEDTISLAEKKVWIEQVTKIMSEEIDKLKEDERIILSLYYYDELMMKEIGQVMKLTESRICQIHNLVMEKLSRRIKKRVET